ncbi:MAG: methionine--tRNA ligase [Patescibacteria group bacterium]
MNKKKFYITTSIAYTNSEPHIGHALEFVQADVLARYHRQRGDEVFFQTGTDEHGKKIFEKANSEKRDVQDFVDEISERFRHLAEVIGISNDCFIRTSDQKVHYPVVVDFWKKLVDKGDIYKDIYNALYCVGCEAFLGEKDLSDGLCPIHKKSPEHVSEENYFFSLSKYIERVRVLIEKDEIKIIPVNRKKEILNLLESERVSDVSFSRPKESVGWGIDVPGDKSQKIYVWADALTNYISGLGGLGAENYKKFWPADIHLIGKDILRFHAMIWPAMLLALDIETPKNIYVHGFITQEGEKMSKSLGNVVSPFALIEKYGKDALRYYLLREIPSYQDGDFSALRFQSRYEDLANKLGNLISRVSAIAEKNKDILGDIKISKDDESDIIKNIFFEYEKNIESFNLNLSLENIFKLVEISDKMIEESKLWELPKKDIDGFKKIIKELALYMADTAYLLVPFLPDTSIKIFNVLGISEDRCGWEKQILNIKKPDPIFPRIDTKVISEKDASLIK